MRHGHIPATLAALAVGLGGMAACASSGPSPEPDEPRRGGCAFEVINETRRVLSVTAGGSRLQRLGDLEPAGRARFYEDCGVDQVSVTATPTETVAAVPDQGHMRDGIIQMTVAPDPGGIVRVPLRFDWRRR
ncbi:MAG TPA: hypothetical protein VLL48_11375 [Longimicrobiales bacterium]|nr:hypothetical protein [Longimicrobiales bacterium]